VLATWSLEFHRNRSRLLDLPTADLPLSTRNRLFPPVATNAPFFSFLPPRSLTYSILFFLSSALACSPFSQTCGSTFITPPPPLPYAPPGLPFLPRPVLPSFPVGVVYPWNRSGVAYPLSSFLAMLSFPPPLCPLGRRPFSAGCDGPRSLTSFFPFFALGVCWSRSLLFFSIPISPLLKGRLVSATPSPLRPFLSTSNPGWVLATRSSLLSSLSEAYHLYQLPSMFSSLL